MGKGFIHSLETFGTVDGPGIRFVVFMQGCPLRCAYCHNPDSWKTNIGNKMSIEEILEIYDKKKSFYKNGGLTITGGEPLIQIDFVTKLFKEAKKRGIHTCLDTSGITFNRSKEVLKKFNALINVTDLILLDLKHINNEKHEKLTLKSNIQILDFARYLNENNIDVWIRHVVVPTITDNEADLYQLGLFIGELKNVKALDILPYHEMGKTKYEELGLDYPLKHLNNLSQEKAIEAKKIVLQGIKDYRNQENLK
jgi:pyruvate formate-lyase 1-activating enzyme